MTDAEKAEYMKLLDTEIRTFANRVPACVIKGSANVARNWKAAADEGLKAVNAARPNLERMVRAQQKLRGFAFDGKETVE